MKYLSVFFVFSFLFIMTIFGQDWNGGGMGGGDMNSGYSGQGGGSSDMGVGDMNGFSNITYKKKKLIL